MKRTLNAIIWGIIVMFLTSMAFAQEDKEQQEAGKEKKGFFSKFGEKWAGTPYAYTGPDTGVGAGFAIIYRDMFGKEGRDTSFGLDITQTAYTTYSLTWDEPELFSKDARGKISINYDSKPARRFYGIGNESNEKDLCNWDYLSENITPEYMIRTSDYKWGAIGRFHYEMVKAMNGTLKGSDDKLWERKISKEFPDFYNSRDFASGTISGPGIYLFHDDRVDRMPIGGGRQDKVFPMSGGREEFFFSRYDPTFGSDFGYNEWHVDLRRFFKLFNENTVLAVRAKLNVTDGDVPFYVMSNLNSDIRGYYDGRYRDHVDTALNVELRQMFVYSLPVKLGPIAVTLDNPFLVLFWDEGRVFPDLNSVTEDWRGYHYSYGGAFCFVVSPSVVIRMELSWSTELSQSLTLTSGLQF